MKRITGKIGKVLAGLAIVAGITFVSQGSKTVPVSDVFDNGINNTSISSDYSNSTKPILDSIKNKEQSPISEILLDPSNFENVQSIQEMNDDTLEINPEFVKKIKNYFVNPKDNPEIEEWLDKKAGEFFVENSIDEETSQLSIKSAILYHYMLIGNEDYGMLPLIEDINERISISAQLSMSIANKETGIYDDKAWMKSVSDRSNANGRWQILPVAAFEFLIQYMEFSDVITIDEIPKDYYSSSKYETAKSLIETMKANHPEFDWNNKYFEKQIKDTLEFARRLVHMGAIQAGIKKGPNGQVIRSVTKDGEEISFKKILSERIPGKTYHEKIDNLSKIYLSLSRENPYFQGVLALAISHQKNVLSVYRDGKIIYKPKVAIPNDYTESDLIEILKVIGRGYNGDHNRFTKDENGKIVSISEDYARSIISYYNQLIVSLKTNQNNGLTNGVEAKDTILALND